MLCAVFYQRPPRRHLRLSCKVCGLCRRIISSQGRRLCWLPLSRWDMKTGCGRVHEGQGPRPPADWELHLYQGRLCAGVPTGSLFHADFCVRCSASYPQRVVGEPASQVRQVEFGLRGSKTEGGAASVHVSGFTCSNFQRVVQRTVTGRIWWTLAQGS